MDFKEFKFDENIRVCIYNIGVEGPSYHKHSMISDITCCTKGQITVEMLDSKIAQILRPGELVQVPRGERHRCVNSSSSFTVSRYILLQIGAFDIKFIDDHKYLGSTTNLLKQRSITSGVCNIGISRNRINEIIIWFTEHKHENLSIDEKEDIIKSLSTIVENSIEQSS